MTMKKKIILMRYGGPVGLLLISLSTVANFEWHIPDFWNGFCKGLGITLMIASFVMQRRIKKPA